MVYEFYMQKFYGLILITIDFLYFCFIWYSVSPYDHVYMDPDVRCPQKCH